MENPGYIYIIQNDSQGNDIFKIGKTSRTVDERINELNKDTSLIGKFNIISVFYVNDIDDAESDCHKKLDAYRIQNNREFFKGKKETIVSKTKSILEKYLVKETMDIDANSNVDEIIVIFRLIYEFFCVHETGFDKKEGLKKPITLKDIDELIYIKLRCDSKINISSRRMVVKDIKEPGLNALSEFGLIELPFYVGDENTTMILKSHYTKMNSNNERYAACYYFKMGSIHLSLDFEIFMTEQGAYCVKATGFDPIENIEIFMGNFGPHIYTESSEILNEFLLMVNIIIPEEKVVGEGALEIYNKLLEHEYILDFKSAQEMNPWTKDVVK